MESRSVALQSGVLRAQCSPWPGALHHRGPGTQCSSNILESFYQRCLEHQPSRFRAALSRFIEERLPSEAGDRETVTLETAVKELQSQGVPRSAFDQLVQDRLLQIEDRLGAKRIELTHDRLAQVVLKSRERGKVKRRERRFRRRFYVMAASPGVCPLGRLPDCLFVE